jgi:DNA-binding NtrC family response regulator
MIRILIVDDTLRDHERCRVWLADEGIEVIGCTTGIEAQQLVGDMPKPGAVLVHWDLPSPMSGREVLQWLRRHHPEVPVLVLSKLIDWRLAPLAKRLGAKGILVKPLERERLRRAVRVVLGERPRLPFLDELQQRLIGKSRAFLEMLEKLALFIARPNVDVLLVGERGTGKELVAKAIHDLGAVDKAKERWIPCNVANLSEALIESTLFGHEEGAFTGAISRQIGKFERCGEGTLFLDEIGEIPLALQPKLLRVLQDRNFERLGGSETLHCNARLVFATNRDLHHEQQQGRFREDLYDRISGNQIHVPPLREREDDRWLLVDYFLAKYAHGNQLRLAQETRMLLATFSFPGNVRELETTIRNALIQASRELVQEDCGELLPFHLPVESMEQRQPPPPEEEVAAIAWPEYLFGLPQQDAVKCIENIFNREYLPRKLRETGGNITQAAAASGLTDHPFRKKWKDAGLNYPPSLKE